MARVLAAYEDDRRFLWSYSIPTYWLGSHGVQAGWIIAAPDIGPPPAGLRRRFVTLRSQVDGTRRRLYVSDSTSNIWTGVTRTVNLPHSNGTIVTYDVRGRVGETRHVRPGRPGN